MNHLSKRCGCGAIFTLPNLKSRETRCVSCARPTLTFGPAQTQRALACLFLFAGELSARGVRATHPNPFRGLCKALDAVRLASEPASDTVDAARYALRETGGSASYIERAVEQVRGVVSSRVTPVGIAHMSVKVWVEKGFFEQGVVDAIERSRPAGISYNLMFSGCPAKPTGSHPGPVSVKVYT